MRLSRAARRTVTLILPCLLLLLGLGCRAPLRGIEYGAGSDPFFGETDLTTEAWSDTPLHRLVLIGDAGDPVADDPTLALVGSWADMYPERTTVVYLGDNLYPAGLQDTDRARGESVLRQQIEATSATKIMIPGNHDWGFTGVQSLQPRVLGNQQAFVDAQASLDARFLPKDGCPGPIPVELLGADSGISGGLVLVVVDLHWWLLEEEDRPVCQDIADTTAFVEAFRKTLDRHRDRNVVVVSHHPLRSTGPHGGLTRGIWYDIGVSIFYRFYTVQDLIEPNYREMIGVLSEVAAENPPIAFVGGHDHSLQIFDGGDASDFMVVSGAGSKVSKVTSGEGMLFGHAQLGFIVFDFHSIDGDASGALSIHVVETGKEGPVFSLGMRLLRGERPPDLVDTEDGPTTTSPSPNSPGP